MTHKKIFKAIAKENLSIIKYFVLKKNPQPKLSTTPVFYTKLLYDVIWAGHLGRVIICCGYLWVAGPGERSRYLETDVFEPQRQI